MKKNSRLDIFLYPCYSMYPIYDTYKKENSKYVVDFTEFSQNGFCLLLQCIAEL